MKTITMDYKIYIEELKQAKLDGFNLTEGLCDKILALINATESYKEKDYYKVRGDIYSIISELRKVEKK